MQNQVESDALNSRRDALIVELKTCRNLITRAAIDNEIFVIDEHIRFIRLGIKRVA